jgi:PA14 domain-containing protein/CotH protein/Big-like domain-containing protein/chitobiase/beta-hexosaminidase-like protein/lamin tail-like protein/Ig-like domain-containing protein
MLLNFWLRAAFVFLLVASTLPAFGSEAVTISEFAASNTTGLRDENGDYSDWIEIFNSGTNTVNMDGWFLTDSPGNLTRWRFPATNLPPSGFLVVFASGKNRAVPGAPLHANFSLGAGGEYLALVKPDGFSIASEFTPEFPRQFSNISYGTGQELMVTRLVSNATPARVLVPTNGFLGTAWTATNFNDATWRAGQNGVGYETYVSGFAVRNIRANIGVCDLATAESVAATPAQQAAVFTANRPVINFVNTGAGANFGSDATFPGFTIGVEENNFVTEATGIITIPSIGVWTFGVNSDDGFAVTIGTNSFSYPAPRGPGDTLATFNLTPGDYPVRLIFYECGGGSEVEFYAVAGTFSAFTPSARLVGDTAGGGLAVKSLPMAGGATSLRPLIATDVQTQMVGRASSAYIRLPFNVADPAVFSSLTLRMKYDDGFVAYLNGTEVARRNVPALLQWNSVAPVSRANTSVVIFEDIDVTSRLNLLQSGTNVLAIHGLNDSINSPDFLVLAELVENKVLGLAQHYFSTPTPGSFNSPGFYAFVENLKFTPGRDWFDNTNVSVTITSATPEITIRYTLDGSIPTTTNGLLYTDAISVTNTLAIRAIGFREGFEPTELETHSYIFLDQVQSQSTNSNYAGGSSGNYTLSTNITQSPLYRDTFKSDLLGVPTLSITMRWEDLFGVSGIYSNPGGEGVAWERPCSLEYMRPDGEDGFHVNCGIRIQGGASRSLVPKHGFRVLFKNIYGPGKLDYDLYPDSPVKEFDTLTLHATFNDHWLWGGAAATMQRDQWCRDTQNAMGGYGPHGTYVHLYVNGIYWGLYNIGEKGDASYAAHYLGGEKEEYDAFNSDELIDGTVNAWNTMFAIANAGVSNDIAYTNISGYLNIPNFIDYMLMNFYAATTDWPWHNWNAARRRMPGAGFHFFSWDAEWTFGIGADVNTDRTSESAGSPGRLYSTLRAHPEFRREFGDHAQKHCFNNGALAPGPAEARWLERAVEIERSVVPESARWGNGNTLQTWQAAEASVRSWFPQRTAILVNQLRAAGLYPGINAPIFSQFGGLVPPGYNLSISNANAAGVIYFTLDGSDPRRWGGAVSPTAQIYSAPIVLANAAFIRARIFDSGNWSAVVEANFYVVQDVQALAVTEIMYHPPIFGATDDDEVEFLELKNTGTNTLDLSGLQFTDGMTFAFTNGAQLAPGQFFVLARNPLAFAAKYPGVTVNGIYSGRLDNGGERLSLAHLLGANVFSFRYETTPPWPVTPDGYGFSLVRADTQGDPDAAASWRQSANAGGSPGADDPPLSVPQIFINEILTHTDPPEVDTIELYNPNATDVNIGGWFLSDDPKQPKKFRIPNDTIITPGAFAVFTEADFNPQPGVPPSFALSSHGETLCLFSGDTTTNLTGYSHSFDYGAAANGVSFGRYVISTGEEQWPAMSSNTLGASNSAPRVGPLVINEIMYHPALGYDEFLEIYNLSASEVLLHDAAYPANAWKLSGLGYTFSNNISIPAGGFLLLVAGDPAAFRSKYAIAPGVQIIGPYPGALQDSGERLRLERPDTPETGTNGDVFVPYITVDEVRYNDKLPWAPGADGDGPSLQRRAPGFYGNEPTNWFASGITPGAENFFNQAPTCVLAAPTNNAVFTVPADILLSAEASDSDGQIVRVEFYNDDVLLGMVTNAPFTFTWSNASVGVHRLTGKARDNGLAVSPSPAVTITVNPPPVGTGIGLRADYFDNIDFTGARLRRLDAVINFDWGSGPPDPSMGPEQFSVRWVGQVQPRFSETYAFHTLSDDGVRLWVNNQLLVGNWTDHAPTENVGFASLQAGFLYDIKMEMYENGGGALASLFWSAPSTSREIVPSTQLYPPTSSNIPPSITITSPATGAVFVATSTINLLANANDLDGVVYKVEFFSGPTKLGEDVSNPFGFAWSNVPAGQQTLRAIATDDSGLMSTSAPVTISVLAGFTTNITLIATGSVWRYRDTGEDLAAAWTALGFNDTGWSNGPAQLGYGDGDERTIVSFGPNAGAKYITTYFRRSFNVDVPSSCSSLNLRLLRDDGAVIYLNGSEIHRDNMPGGVVGYLTPAVAAIGGADESTYYSAAINPGYLVPGNNVLAVEIHQSGGGSSDVSFDFELAGGQNYIEPYITRQPASQSAEESSTAIFTVTAEGTQPMRYQWRFEGTNISNATNATLALANVAASQAGDYLVVITNAAGAVTSMVATLTITSSDSDGDGMPDAWEIAHGLNANINDAALDADGDRMANRHEYEAGTDPQDPLSYLKVNQVSVLGSGLCQLTFLAISNRTYTVLYTDSLNTNLWSTLANISARPTNRVEVVSDTNTNVTRKFYRLATPALPQ